MAMRRLFLWVLAATSLFLSGCPGDEPRPPDPTRGTVTGLVVCTDTGKPARFASVLLLPAYDAKTAGKGPDKNSVDLDEDGTTGLDGRFKIEAVPPGDYYAFASLDGYVDATLAVDQHRLGPQASEREKLLDEIDQWKDHLVEVTVAAQHTSDIDLTLDRGAEIAGTVSYDDSSPAIGIRFALLRKTAQDHWIRVGQDDSGSMDEKSDGRGRYTMANLPAGAYRVCALLPVKDERASPDFCFGGGFRISKAETVKVGAGESHPGVDIVLPLDGLFAVSGRIAAGVDGHAPTQATVRLLYADDREEARQTAMQKDGSFSFAWMPADNYILEVTNAQDIAASAPAESVAGSSGADPAAPPPATPPVRKYLDKETPLFVQSDMNDVMVTLMEAPPPQPANP